MSPRDVHVSEEEISEITALAAEGATEGNSGKDDKEAQQKLQGLFSEIIKTSAFKEIVNTGKEIAKKDLESGVDPKKVIGKLARTLYDAAESALGALTSIAKSAMKVIKGILFGVCLIASAIVMITLGVIRFVVAILSAMIKGVWTVIKSVTGFVWSVFVSAVKNPAFWATVTAVGAGVAIANPLVGAVIAGVGAIGTGVSLAMQ